MGLVNQISDLLLDPRLLLLEIVVIAVYTLIWGVKTKDLINAVLIVSIITIGKNYLVINLWQNAIKELEITGYIYIELINIYIIDILASLIKSLLIISIFKLEEKRFKYEVEMASKTKFSFSI